MIPPPVAIGLVVCERVIVEEATKNVSLISTFTRFVVRSFPFAPQRFDVFATLTDGLGPARIKLVITRLETDSVVFERDFAIRFPDRLAELRVRFQVGECSFPAPGIYLIALLVDGDLVAQRRLQLIEREV
jgi:hypothetical protein